MAPMPLQSPIDNYGSRSVHWKVGPGGWCGGSLLSHPLNRHRCTSVAPDLPDEGVPTGHVPECPGVDRDFEDMTGVGLEQHLEVGPRAG